MAQTHSETYRAFDIEVDVSDSVGGSVQVMRLTIRIKGQNKRIPIAPYESTSADFPTADRAIEQALKQARWTIDRLLGSQRG